MLNYIKSEIYRITRTKGIYLSFIFCALTIFAFNFALFYFKNQEGFRYGTTKFSYSSIYTSMSVLIYFVILICTVVQGDEYKYHTFKNSVAAGVKRSTMYFGRFLAEVVVCILFYVTISGLHIILGESLLKNSGVEYMNILVKSLLVCIPIFLACAAISHCFYYVFDNGVVAIVGVFSVVIVASKIIEFAALKLVFLRKIVPYLITNILNAKWDEAYNLTLTWDTTEGLVRTIAVGVVATIAFCIIGYEIFKKKELK
ncbi:MAG TPA: ABC transporter permease [Lachnospiraceae bacterium]|nr:ABC transporter permease [Lachnospiraceae bacterium]